MKFTQIELEVLTTPDGGKFAVRNLDDAYSFCRGLALGHYENFPVASILLPQKTRKHIFAVYAFARIADDISDEISIEYKDKKLELLDSLILNLRDFTYEVESNPILYALSNTLKELILDINLFERLITAFKMDADFQHPESTDELLDYCSYSANPIGEIVLSIFGQNSTENVKLSDDICTALQLTNFWQDFSRDLPNFRYYIPINYLNRYGLTKENLERQKKSAKFNACMSELYTFTDTIFDRGTKLITNLKPLRLKFEIAITLEGGKTILNRSKELGADILTTRPDLTKFDFAMILFKSLKYLWKL